MRPSAEFMTNLWRYVAESYFELYAWDWRHWQREPDHWRYASQFPRRPEFLRHVAGWLIRRGYLDGDPGTLPWAWSWVWP